MDFSKTFNECRIISKLSMFQVSMCVQVINDSSILDKVYIKNIKYNLSIGNMILFYK